MYELRNVVCLTLVFYMFVTAASAQGFPWQDFKPRTLKDILKLDTREIEDSMQRNSLIMHADPLFSVVKVKYSGKNRPISPLKKDLLTNWAKTMGHPEDYKTNYERDYMFYESGLDYWLPVQKKVSSYFLKELKEGDDIAIYLVRVGGVCIKKECDWLFLVEEYQKPKVTN